MSLSIPKFPTTPGEAISALKSLTANAAHLTFTIAGQKHDAISFDGTEEISAPFSATLYVLAELDAGWLGQPGVVTLTDASGNERTMAGIVTYQRDRGLNAKNQSRVEVTLRLRLWVLMDRGGASWIFLLPTLWSGAIKYKMRPLDP